MADAIRLIRAELGADAVILSSRKAPHPDTNAPGLEVTAAMESAAAPAPLAAAPAFTQPASGPKAGTLAEHLARHGIDQTIRGKIQAAVDAMTSTGFSDFDTLEMVLGKMVPFIAPAQALEKGKTHVFIGPTGSGKTTTIAKIAVNKRLARYSVGMMSWDYQKVGGFDQLNIFADAMKEPAFLLRNRDDVAAAALSIGPRDFILVDTPGVNAFNNLHITRLKEQIGWLGNNIATHLVLPATMNPLEMTYIPAALQALQPQTVIFTKLDETSHYGGLANVAAMSSLKVCFMTDGTRVPSDICEMNAALLAKKLMTQPYYPWEAPQT